MFYRLDSEHYDSNYLYVDWETFDACLRPTDRDAGGRLCGKRARAAAGKLSTTAIIPQKDGSKKVKTGAINRAKAAQVAEEIRAAKGMKSKFKVGMERQTRQQQAAEARKAELAPIRKAAGEKSARTKARKKAEVDYLANNPAARKAVEKRLSRQGNSKLSDRLKSAQAKQKVAGELDWEDLKGVKSKRSRRR